MTRTTTFDAIADTGTLLVVLPKAEVDAYWSTVPAGTNVKSPDKEGKLCG